MAMHGDKRSRGVLAGLAAAAGAFGAAAMMSAAGAPAAHADDLAAIVSDIEGNLSYGQTAIGTALTDFDSGNALGGLAAFTDAVEDDTVGVADIAYIGGVDEFTNEPFSLVDNFFDFNAFDVPTSFTDAVNAAEQLFGEGYVYSTDISTALSSGDYGEAATYEVASPLLLFDLPLQELFLGAAATFSRATGLPLVGGATLDRDNFSLRALQRQADGSWIIVSEMFQDANTETTYAR
jgi:hypothetical protein